MARLLAAALAVALLLGAVWGKGAGADEHEASHRRARLPGWPRPRASHPGHGSTKRRGHRSSSKGGGALQPELGRKAPEPPSFERAQASLMGDYDASFGDLEGGRHPVYTPKLHPAPHPVYKPITVCIPTGTMLYDTNQFARDSGNRKIEVSIAKSYLVHQFTYTLPHTLPRDRCPPAYEHREGEGAVGFPKPNPNADPSPAPNPGEHREGEGAM